MGHCLSGINGKVSLSHRVKKKKKRLTILSPEPTKVKLSKCGTWLLQASGTLISGRKVMLPLGWGRGADISDYVSLNRDSEEGTPRLQTAFSSTCQTLFLYTYSKYKQIIGHQSFLRHSMKE